MSEDGLAAAWLLLVPLEIAEKVSLLSSSGVAKVGKLVDKLFLVVGLEARGLLGLVVVAEAGVALSAGGRSVVGMAEASVLKSAVTKAGKAGASWSVTQRSHKSFCGVAQRLPKSSVAAEVGV